MSQKIELDGPALVGNWRAMVLVREFEEAVHQAYVKGLVHGSTHLCQGQEAVVVGAVTQLWKQDFLTYTYRGHGVCIARGMDLKAAFAELFGRASGVCGGYGGSMHLTDPKLGLIGSFGIVGAGLPVAVGAGLSCQLSKSGGVSVTFFGDGATNIGEFHESLNLAAIWKLPVIFICENNLYGEFSRINHTTPIEDLYLRGVGYGMTAKKVDGNDVEAVAMAVEIALLQAREGGGPTLLEMKTYRHRGHSRSDPATYRPREELDTWKERDPLKICEQKLLARGILDAQELNTLRDKIVAEVAAAMEAAKAADWPEPSAIRDRILSEVQRG